MNHTFGDSLEDKGVWLLDDDWKPEFIPLKSPKFITHEIPVNREPLDYIKEICEDQFNYHKIVLTDETIDVPNLPSNVVIEWNTNQAPSNHYTEEERHDNLEKDVIEFITKSNTALDKERLIQMAKGML